MNTVYNIIVNIKTLNGRLQIGSFFLGTDIDFANSTFEHLTGDINPTDESTIRIDLVKTEEKCLPVLLGSKSCTLDQYTENSKMIARKIFTFFTLEK